MVRPIGEAWSSWSWWRFMRSDRDITSVVASEAGIASFTPVQVKLLRPFTRAEPHLNRAIPKPSPDTLP
jgi:hypothetical protein